MKKIAVALGILSVFTVVSAYAQSSEAPEASVFVPISKYFEQGDTDCIAAWFADNLEMEVLGKTNNCSKNQAKQILRSFFMNYTPKNFVIVYTSGSYPMQYAVGNLDGGGSSFRVTFLVKTNEVGNYIEQLKIEKK